MDVEAGQDVNCAPMSMKDRRFLTDVICLLFFIGSLGLKVTGAIFWSDHRSDWSLFLHLSLACDIPVVFWVVIRKEDIKACLLGCGEYTDYICGRPVDKSSCKKTCVSLLYTLSTICFVVLLILKLDVDSLGDNWWLDRFLALSSFISVFLALMCGRHLFYLFA